MKKTAIIFLLILSVQFFASPAAAVAGSPGSVAANSALLIENDSGTILFEHDINRRHPADSFAKVMTLLLAANAVENDEISDNELIEMTEAAWEDINDNSTTQSILPGQMITFIDLMYSAFVGSANEACNMIAIRLAGSTDSFVRMMNQKAVELGCRGTMFVNPHGQYSDNQYTTAYDMYLLFSEAYKSKLFTEIASTYRHTTERSDETESRTLVSPNSMLNQGSIYYYRFCLAGATSNTYEGGYSLAAIAEEDGMTLICIVLGAREVINEDESVTLRHFTEAHRLFMWGYENYGWREIIKTTDLIARVPVEHGSGADYVNVRPERSLTLLLASNVTNESFDMDINIFSERRETPLVAPVTAGDVLGEVTVSRDGQVYDTISLIANTDIELNGMEYMRRQITDVLSTRVARNIIIALIVIVAIYAALVIRYNIMRINRLRRIRAAKENIIRERQQRHDYFSD